jgi:hypothetical protein
VKGRHNGVTAGAKHSAVQAPAMIAPLCRLFHLERGTALLLALRFLVSAEWPNGVDGRYYWQHCAWLDRDDFTTDTQMANRVVVAMRSLYTTQIRFHSERYYLPGTETVYFERFFAPTEGGIYPPSESPNLLICARWRMYGEDGSYTYHLHRSPVGDDDLIDAVWSDDGFFRQDTHLGDFIDEGFFRTHTGSLIDWGQVAQLPVKWQLRHGTKRRLRRFWLP